MSGRGKSRALGIGIETWAYRNPQLGGTKVEVSEGVVSSCNYVSQGKCQVRRIWSYRSQYRGGKEIRILGRVREVKIPPLANEITRLTAQRQMRNRDCHRGRSRKKETHGGTHQSEESSRFGSHSCLPHQFFMS